MAKRGRPSNAERALLSTTQVSASLPDDISIDDLMSKGLKAMYGIMRSVNADVSSGAPSRNTVMNLKDLMGILQILKKEERDILAAMSEEELESIAKK